MYSNLKFEGGTDGCFRSRFLRLGNRGIGIEGC